MATLILASHFAYSGFVRHGLGTRKRAGLSTAHRFLMTCAFVSLFCSFASPKTSRETAHGYPAVADSLVIENNGSPVEIDGKPILLIYAPIGGFSPQD